MAKMPDLYSIASEVKSAQDDVRQIEPFASRWSDFDVGSAYRVARVVHDARLAEGATPVGRKIGFTNHDMWSRYGVYEPIWAYVYENSVTYMSGGQGRCSLSRFAEPKIEPEIVFHLRSTPASGSGLTALLECIDWVANGLEVVQSHFPRWEFLAPDTIADQALHGTLLVGEPQTIESLGSGVIEALSSFSIALSRDGKVRENGRGANVLGSPLAALAHLIDVLSKQPESQPLRANELITTGTLTRAHAVQAADTWSTELNGIGIPGLRVAFTV